jgi:uncharacterized protein (DUF3084 family)
MEVVTPANAAALEGLSDAVRMLQRSARHSLPLILLGVLATLVAAGVALYYILSLSHNLRAAKGELARSEIALRIAQDNLTLANDTLKKALAEQEKLGRALEGAGEGKSQQSKDAAKQSQAAIKAVIQDVARSEKNVREATTSVSQAAERINRDDMAQQQAPAESGGTGWFAVVGSYPAKAGGLDQAKAQYQKVIASGQCAQIWRTVISNSYAVVLGGRLSRGEAQRRARDARKQGLAGDAFAQPDRDWKQISGPC